MIQFGPMMTSRENSIGKFKNETVEFSETFVRFITERCRIAPVKFFEDGFKLSSMGELGYKQITCDPKENPINLANFIIENIGSKLEFGNLVLPFKAVEYCHNLWMGNVIIRYIEDYMPSSDETAGRYDVLVRAV